MQYLYNLPRNVLIHLLRSESRSKGYSDAAVRVSMLLDVDAGQVKSQRDYANIWGWSRNKVRYHWTEIWHDVALWATSNGRQQDTRMAQKLPAKWLKWVETKHPLTTQQPPTYHPPKSASSGENDDASQEKPPTYHPDHHPPTTHHTKKQPQPTSYKGKKERESARAREDHDPSQPDPSEEEEQAPDGVADKLDLAAEWWNGIAEAYDLPSVRARNEKRKSGVRQRFEEVWDHRREIEREIQRSRFLRGEVNNWRMDFDFLFCTRDGYTKILEGKYRDTKHRPKDRPRHQSSGERKGQLRAEDTTRSSAEARQLLKQLRAG